VRYPVLPPQIVRCICLIFPLSQTSHCSRVLALKTVTGYIGCRRNSEEAQASTIGGSFVLPHDDHQNAIMLNRWTPHTHTHTHTPPMWQGAYFCTPQMAWSCARSPPPPPCASPHLGCGPGARFRSRCPEIRLASQTSGLCSLRQTQSTWTVSASTAHTRLKVDNCWALSWRLLPVPGLVSGTVPTASYGEIR